MISQNLCPHNHGHPGARMPQVFSHKLSEHEEYNVTTYILLRTDSSEMLNLI